MKARQLLAAIMLAGCLMPAFGAGLESFDFSGNVQEQRFKDLLGELRCLVCQNQSLADSNADLAGDLRLEVYELMAKGQSDDEIREYLVARYGDFVLYDPPLKPSTYLLWFTPFVLLALGLLMLFRTLRQRRELREADQFSTSEQRRLRELLGEAPDDQEDRA
jgi:cytochrome c-type biogenesis protein CcmH